MGCVSSKHVIEPLDVYRPTGASIALFNLEADHEELTWQQQQLYSDHEKKNYQVVVQQVHVANDHVPKPILDKLQTFELTSELAPKSWTEVSKVLEVLTTPPAAQNPKTAAHPVVISDIEIINGRVIKPAATYKDEEDQMKKAIITVNKYDNFHTVEELDSNQQKQLLLITDDHDEKKKKKQLDDQMMIITDDHQKPLVPADPQMMKLVVPPISRTAADTNNNNNNYNNIGSMIKSSTTSKVINDNYFIVMDRMLRNSKDGSTPLLARRRRIDPLEGLPEKCPPSGKDTIVLYTTSVRGVRRTFEDCRRVKLIMEGYQIAFDERDVSLHGEYLSELRELLLGLPQLDRSTTITDHEAAAGGGVINIISVPRLFIKGRYVGGVDEVMEFNEAEKLGPMLETVVSSYTKNMINCEGCGGLRFILCLDCNGSCKVVVLISSTTDDHHNQRKDREVIRCLRCNENGLIQCPMCH